MWDFSFKTSFQVIGRSWPFLVMRTLVYGSFALIFLVLTGSGALIGHEIGPSLTDMQSTQTAIIGTFGGVALAGMVLRILREYTLYLVKAGHIAIMNDMLFGKETGSGLNQIKAGASVVRANFAETSTLFVLDQLIKAVLKTVEDFFKKLGAFIPFLAPIFGLVHSIVTVAVTYVDEMILAHIMRTRPTNPWRAGADALVIYAQNAKYMFKNAFWLAMFLIVVEISIFAATYLFLPVPEAYLSTMPDAEVTIRFVAGIAMIMLSALIFFEPFAVCTMLQVFNKVAYSQQPDPEVERKLAEKSKEFRELREHRDQPNFGAIQAAE